MPTAAGTSIARVARRVQAEVVSVRPEGRRQRLILSVRGSEGRERQAGVDTGGGPMTLAPGQFIALPPEPSEVTRHGRVLPTLAWLAGVHDDPVHGASIEVIWETPDSIPHAEPVPVGVRQWLAPLGRPLPLPTDAVPAMVVGDAAGQGVARWLTAALVGRGSQVALILSGGDPEDHLDLTSSRRVTDQVWVTERGDLAATMAKAAARAHPAVVYSVAPTRISQRIAEIATEWGVVAQVTAFSPEQGGCGTGLCGHCALSVRARGAHRTVLPCCDGPVLPATALVRSG